ncbi:MAG: RecX family transcriptional regulator [Bacteroidota bacterium]
MLITKIERQKKNARRASIYLDGKFAVGVHEETLTRFGLRKGDTLDGKTLEDLRQAEELFKAKEKAMRLLSYRARSEKEIRDRLKKASYRAPIVDEVVDALTRSGLLDDATFARMYAHDTMARKPFGKQLLRQQLRGRGVAKEIIEKLIAELYTPQTEESFALSLAKKHLVRSLRSPPAKKLQDLVKQKKRLADYLVRRGFDWETVSSVVSKLLPNHS